MAQVQERGSTHVYKVNKISKEEMESMVTRCVYEEPPFCNAACPLKLDTRAMLKAAAAGDYKKALQLYEKAAVFPLILSAGCEAPCEAKCRLCEVGDGIAIRDIETAVARFGQVSRLGGVFRTKKKKTVDMKVFSAEEYMHKVETRQTWTTIFTVAAEVAVTAAVAYAESEADKSHRHDRHKEPPRHHGWHSARHSHHPYYPTDHYRSRYHSHDMGGLATAAVAVGSVAITAGMIEDQNAKREKLESSYIKPNTIRKGKEYLGYFHIKHENTDNLEVTIPMMGEDFTFRFEWQNKK